MTIPTPYNSPLDWPLLTRDERLWANAGYERGYVDAQAHAQKLAEALRTVTAQLATYMESSAWEDDDGIAYDAADAALQEWDAAQKEGAHA